MKNLKKLLDNNCNVVIKDDDGYYSLFVPLKNRHDNYRSSDWETTIEEAKISNIEDYGYSKEGIENYLKADNWQIVEVYRTTTPPLAVGTPVKILDSIKKCDDWENLKENFSKMKGTITGFYNRVDSSGYRVKVGGFDWSISVDYIILDIEEKTQCQ